MGGGRGGGKPHLFIYERVALLLGVLTIDPSKKGVREVQKRKRFAPPGVVVISLEGSKKTHKKKQVKSNTAIYILTRRRRWWSRLKAARS